MTVAQFSVNADRAREGGKLPRDRRPIARRNHGEKS
jgi:hypothetical protein